MYDLYVSMCVQSQVAFGKCPEHMIEAIQNMSSAGEPDTRQGSAILASSGGQVRFYEWWNMLQTSWLAASLGLSVKQ